MSKVDDLDNDQKFYDSVQLRENILFNRLLDDAMEAHQRNADAAALDNDRLRLEAAIARRTLKLFKERCLQYSTPKS